MTARMAARMAKFLGSTPPPSTQPTPPGPNSPQYQRPYTAEPPGMHGFLAPEQATPQAPKKPMVQAPQALPLAPAKRAKGKAKGQLGLRFNPFPTVSGDQTLTPGNRLSGNPDYWAMESNRAPFLPRWVSPYTPGWVRGNTQALPEFGGNNQRVPIWKPAREV